MSMTNENGFKLYITFCGRLMSLFQLLDRRYLSFSSILFPTFYLVLPVYSKKDRY